LRYLRLLKTKPVQRESTFVQNAFDHVGLVFDNR